MTYTENNDVSCHMYKFFKNTLIPYHEKKKQKITSIIKQYCKQNTILINSMSPEHFLRVTKVQLKKHA